MEKLNVSCNSCDTGKLVILDLVNDDYKMGCDTCTHTFWTHYTGFDIIMEEHEYNEEVCESVKILNKSGVWYTNQIKNEMRFNALNFTISEYTKNMKHIQTINSYDINHYFQDGGNFVRIVHNQIHETVTLFKYKANEDCMDLLMNYFFGVKV